MKLQTGNCYDPPKSDFRCDIGKTMTSIKLKTLKKKVRTISRYEMKINKRENVRNKLLMPMYFVAMIIM